MTGTAPPVASDTDAALRAGTWEPYYPAQPLTITAAYLLDLLKRAGVYPDPMPVDLPARVVAAVTTDDECGAWVREQ